MVSFSVLITAVRGSIIWVQLAAWAHSTPIVTSGTKQHSPVHSLGERQRFSMKVVVINSRVVSIMQSVGCIYPGRRGSIKVIIKSRGISIRVEYIASVMLVRRAILVVTTG